MSVTFVWLNILPQRHEEPKERRKRLAQALQRVWIERIFIMGNVQFVVFFIRCEESIQYNQALLRLSL
jgi:hypothetical protein